MKLVRNVLGFGATDICAVSAAFNFLSLSFILTFASIQRKHKGLHLLINLFTVKVKELNIQVCQYTQGIWSYINPPSNEVEAYLPPPSYPHPQSSAPVCGNSSY